MYLCLLVVLYRFFLVVFFFKQKTAYEMRISDWSSDVCSSDLPKAQFGLPESKLGLLPGGGGTQRLPRLIGIQAALPLMLEGKTLKPAQAKQQGIVQELAADHDDMMAKARAWIAANPPAMQP